MATTSIFNVIKSLYQNLEINHFRLVKSLWILFIKFNDTADLHCSMKNYLSKQNNSIKVHIHPKLICIPTFVK